MYFNDNIKLISHWVSLFNIVFIFATSYTTCPRSYVQRDRFNTLELENPTHTRQTQLKAESV